MENIILFRKNLGNENEFNIASKYFTTYKLRSECKNAMVICRYSCLPFYKELELDLINNNCSLINSYKQHKFIANFEYYDLVKDFTPRTWDDNTFCQTQYQGPFVIKGKTNSRKHQWSSMMFAKNRKDAACIASNLSCDSLIGEQGILYREYIPLITYETGIGGIPFSNEWRFFFLGGSCLSYGYYWCIASDDTIARARINQEGIKFAQTIADIIKDHVNFFVVDIAEKESGGWILIELNDGTMSGPSCNNLDKLYGNLFRNIARK